MSIKIRATTWRRGCSPCHLSDNAGIICKSSRRGSAASYSEVLLITKLLPKDTLCHTHGVAVGLPERAAR